MKSKNLLTMFKWSGLLFVLAIGAMPTVSWAALDAFATIVGETQGAFNSGETQAGREDQIRVFTFGHNVSAAYDTATGLPTGKRQHRPVRILKNIDRASPLIASALFNNENLTSVIIRFWKPDDPGKELQFYTIELINAHIVSIMPSHSSRLADSNEVNPVPMGETVTFNYQKIIFTWEDGGITAEDDWQTPTP